MKTFKFWHSIAGTIALVAIELAAVHFVPGILPNITIILLASIAGSLITVYVATEVIEEVHGAFHMILLLTAVVAEFVIFFAFQYFFLVAVQPASFSSLPLDPVSLILHSVMVFVFNPLYIPETGAGRSLMLIETFGALGLVLFVLQNINQFRRKSLDR